MRTKIYSPSLIHSLRLSVLVALASFLFTSGLSAQDVDKAKLDAGKGVYNSNCASCHQMNKVLTGPALDGVVGRWEAAGDFGGKNGKQWLAEWIKNWNTPVKAGYPYAVSMQNFSPSAMNSFSNLSAEQVDNVMYYMENWKSDVKVAPTDATAAADPCATLVDNGNENSFANYFVGGIILLLIIAIVIVSRASRSLQSIADKEEEITDNTNWAWRNRHKVIFVSLLGIIGLGYVLGDQAVSLGRQQNYAPVQPIRYDHKLHAGKYKIDCQYCHSTAANSKHANIPSLGVCMNCHKVVSNGPTYGKAEIAKIYASVGFNPFTREYINDYYKMPKDEVQSLFTKWLETDVDGKPLGKDLVKVNTDQVMLTAQKPVEWVRIHNLPDHVFFNHSQHVTAGQIACQTCHGPIECETQVYQYAPLSMGWCLNCHRETAVKFNENGYYKNVYQKYHDEIKAGTRKDVKESDIGGTDCQKCHY